MQPYLDQSIMQPVGVKVTIRGGGELLLIFGSDCTIAVIYSFYTNHEDFSDRLSARLYPFLRRERFLCRNVLIIKKMEFLNVAFCPQRSKNFRCQSQPKSVVDDARYPNG